MAKWHGKIGFIKQVQTAPSVWLPEETVREYYGDVKRTTTRWTSNSDSTNDDLKFDNQVSIVADHFAHQNLSIMKWIEISGVKWKISSIETRLPRLILSIGGVYNG